MKTIKLLFFICVACSFSQCSTLKLTEKAPFTITGASYHNWVGGQPGVRGINLIIGLEEAENTEFVSIYFNNRKVKAFTETRKGKKYIVVNIDTSRKMVYVEQTVKVRKGQPMPKIKPPKGQHKTFPFTLKSDEAVICYKQKKQFFYYKISNIKKTETIFYP